MYSSIWVEHINICRIIQYISMLHGFDIALRDAEEVWEHYSESLSAGWMVETYGDLDNMWQLIKNQFISSNETTPEFDIRVKEQMVDTAEMIENDDECNIQFVIKNN